MTRAVGSPAEQATRPAFQAVIEDSSRKVSTMEERAGCRQHQVLVGAKTMATYGGNGR